MHGRAPLALESLRVGQEVEVTDRFGAPWAAVVEETGGDEYA